MRKEGMVTGAGIILIQFIVCGLKICLCENLLLKEKMIKAAVPFLVLMCICTIYTNIRGLYKSHMNLQNGIMCCLLAGSIGAVESVWKGNIFLHVSGGILGCVLGILVLRLFSSGHVGKSEKVSKGQYQAAGLTIGFLGVKYLLKCMGEDKAEKLILFLIFILEIIFMMLGVALLGSEISKNKDKR